MHVLLATAELSPLVKVGGLADAVAGLRGALLAEGVDVTTVLPDHGKWPLEEEEATPLDVPAWAAPATARTGRLPDGSPVTLVDVPGLARPHPYVDADGTGWPDNDRRFMAFSAAVAAVTIATGPDVVHLNDWHTGAALGFLPDGPPSVFAVHNLAYQGVTDGRWLDRIPHRPDAYEWWGGTNPLSGAVALADKVVTVSPTYATEILRPEHGFGLHEALAARVDDLVGITNGIDTVAWDPATDPHLPAPFDALAPAAKRRSRRALLTRLGWSGRDPVAVMVTRLTEQKGVDLALGLAPYLEGIGLRVVLLGSGDRNLARNAVATAAAHPDRFAFVEGYEEAFSHLLFAGADLLLMPSRFEPCGLNQMQAMRYGTVPVASAVGGLRDTVADADADPGDGTGFLAADVSVAGLVDAVHRAVRALRSPTRRRAITQRGMTTDWSWQRPAAAYLELYEGMVR